MVATEGYAGRINDVVVSSPSVKELGKEVGNMNKEAKALSKEVIVYFPGDIQVSTVYIYIYIFNSGIVYVL